MKHPFSLFLLLPLLSLFSCNKGTPPVAAFSVTPESGNTSTEFILDPSASSDAESAKEDLRCRWDWNNDGIWETGYASLDPVIHQFDFIGLSEVKLEVIDEDGLSGTTVKEISIDASGTSGNFFDSRDNQKYKWVRIGSQMWMSQNLNFKTETGSWCYENKEANCLKYGRLYQWEATASNNLGNGKDVCQVGWHMPSDSEFKTLERYVGMEEYVLNDMGRRGIIANKLKSSSGWGAEGNGTNSAGLNVLPSGYRSQYQNAVFESLGYSAHFWSGEEFNSGMVWIRGFDGSENIDRNLFAKDFGLSIRCIKD